MKLLIVTDTWHPEINGVVRTLEMLSREARRAGHKVEIISPSQFRSIPVPTYPQMRLVLDAFGALPGKIDSIAPDAIHIATESALGIAARRYCLKRGLPFTTSYHARLPEFVAARVPMPLGWTYSLLRRFHAPSNAVLVASASIESILRERGFQKLRRWSLGVDTDLFRPRDKAFLNDRRPIHLYVGRVAVEKNLTSFLSLDLPGSKYVVGDGPLLDSLRRTFPSVRFVGVKHGEELAQYYAAADVFVFPSRTDTFGLVMLEALASGTPVAAYPVPGPLDVMGDAEVGCMHDDLSVAIEHALKVSPIHCRNHALRFTWQNCARQFLDVILNETCGMPAGASLTG